ncbi:cell division protein FtsQ/DivIB [uncultured Nocardioides sp.]|uniref:cell division protein FtsQ/DivIB n=2 Tax=uncultured Nocardioides sp. TaxID=198441 RepID=UPI002624627E|nr:FtsQ-type POTRA domain-containing protein [uncultured Nocardioides sp.]
MSQDRTRRAFTRRRWARRWLSWRRALVGLLVLGLLGLATYAVWFSAWLRAEQVTVIGADQLSVSEVERVAAVPLDEPLARVDLGAISTRVQSLAIVKEVDVVRGWPHSVEITVVERQAVAVVQIGTTLRGLDEDGVVFRDFKAPPPDLPRVQTSSGATSESLREAAAVVSALPDDLAPRVDHVSVATVDQIELALRDGRTVVWGSAEDSAQKAEVLEVLLGQEASVYDVSVPSNPTTRQ